MGLRFVLLSLTKCVCVCVCVSRNICCWVLTRCNTQCLIALFGCSVRACACLFLVRIGLPVCGVHRRREREGGAEVYGLMLGAGSAALMLVVVSVALFRWSAAALQRRETERPGQPQLPTACLRLRPGACLRLRSGREGGKWAWPALELANVTHHLL